MPVFLSNWVPKQLCPLVHWQVLYDSFPKNTCTVVQLRDTWSGSSCMQWVQGYSGKEVVKSSNTFQVILSTNDSTWRQAFTTKTTCSIRVCHMDRTIPEQRLPEKGEKKVGQGKTKKNGECLWLVWLLVGDSRAETEHSTKSWLPSDHEHLFSMISFRFYSAHELACRPKDSETLLLTNRSKTDGLTETFGYRV